MGSADAIRESILILFPAFNMAALRLGHQKAAAQTATGRMSCRYMAR
jgi:hypothetical protein